VSKVVPIPKHVATTMHPSEVFDLIAVLRAAVREFDPEFLPESVIGLLDGLVAAYDGDLPQQTTDTEGGTAVTT
jgi:hypothetical protein